MKVGVAGSGPAGLTAAAEQTRRAIDNGAPVVYQAAMFDGRLLAYAGGSVGRGDTRPRCGCCQRTSASAPCACPRLSTCTW